MKQKNIARWRAVDIAKPYTAKLVKLWVAVGAMIIKWVLQKQLLGGEERRSSGPSSSLHERSTCFLLWQFWHHLSPQKLYDTKYTWEDQVKSTSSEEMREQRVKDQKASETAGMISIGSRLSNRSLDASLNSGKQYVCFVLVLSTILGARYFGIKIFTFHPCGLMYSL